MYEMNGKKFTDIYVYQKALKLSENRNQAYEPWTSELDTELTNLFSYMSVLELANHFKRTPGGISARLKKLGIKNLEETPMKRRRQTHNSNLFSIDFDAIEAVLEDANRPLIMKAEEIVQKASSFPSVIENNSTAEDIKEFLKELRAHQKEVSKSRLSDGRPFTDAAGVVKEWFGKTEEKLKSLDMRLASKLSTYTSAVAANAEEVRKRNAELAALNLIQQENKKEIGQAISGESIVTVVTSPNSMDTMIEEEPEVPNVQLVWQAKEFDIQSLNLEKLRPYLTEYAIKVAINAHIKDHGPNQIEGVKYEQVVARKL